MVAGNPFLSGDLGTPENLSKNQFASSRRYLYNYSMGAYYGNANVIMDNTYGYDQLGNMTSKRTLSGETKYTYDQINQLTDVITRNQREHYTYDPVGNRLERKVTAGDQAIIERYAYDNRNRMMQRDVYKEAGLGLGDTYATDGKNTQKFTAQYTYAYDEQGNMLRETMFSGNAYGSNGVNGTVVAGNTNTNGLHAVNTAIGNHSRSFCYDAMNRLTEVTHNMRLIQRNTYDAEGLRSEMEENGRLISFLFDGDKVIAESDGTTGLKRHIRGYELVSSECEQARTYYHYTSDHLGSITDVIAPTGEVCNHYEYDAFGNFTVHNEQVENRFGYAGEQYDPATNFYYLRARFYSPVIARFIQEDSYLGDGLNLYAYVKNNPVMYVDPSGHAGCPAVGKTEVPGSGGSEGGIYSSRKKTLNDIKQDLGLNKNESPISQNMVMLRDANGNPIVYDGNIMYSREMTYDVRGRGIKNNNNEIVDYVVVQDHSYGHRYENGIGNQPSHFNVRPITNTQNGKILGLKEHYYFYSKYTWD